jgi:Bacterial Ig-like domain (group 3)
MKTTWNNVLAATAAAVTLAALALPMPVGAQITASPDINLSQKAGADSECAIAKNPANPLQLFASCNTASAGLFAVRSIDGGTTWIFPDPVDRTIADGDLGQGAAACCDPTLAWDSFGNLFITYLAALVGGSSPSVETLLSTDGGATFTPLASFAGSQDQPTIVAENTTAVGAPVAVWIVWNQSGQMRARGAAVTGLGAVGAFGALQTIPGTSNCSFGDVAIAPDGTVVQVCESPTGTQGPGTLRVNIDADGLGIGNFGAVINATTTNVGGFDFIPPQNSRSVDAEAGLAFDRNALSPRFGRLYMAYTDETVAENNDTDIMLRWSDDNGVTWSAPIRVNNDPAVPIRSQFLPRIATSPVSGNITICWHDARNSASNTAAEEFCAVSTPTPATPTFVVQAVVSDGASTSNGFGVEFGDYAGLAYFPGGGTVGSPRFQHPIWGDTSNSTANNPNGTANFDAYTNWMRGGPSVNEGDPHIRTVDGVHYDFQPAGEFVVLRSADGFEVQTRQTAVPTTFFPGPNPHTGIASCASLNSAVAARVGRSRVTYQPRIDGVPDPTGMELRIDGVLTPLTSTGTALPDGGRVVRSAVGGLEVEFPNGERLVATSDYWSSQGKWYLNIGISGSDALEGVMGVIPPGSWLPALPNGSSLGPIPASLAQRQTDLNVTFANAWRVTTASSLFDYAPGQSTANFTLTGWPKYTPPCDVPKQKPAEPAAKDVAEEACRRIVDRNRREHCVFDVVMTGETRFAETYLRTERLETYGTTTMLIREPAGKSLIFTARVFKRAQGGEEQPRGTVQFFLNDRPVGSPIVVDSTGTARTELTAGGEYRMRAHFEPDAETPFLPSTSQEIVHPTAGGERIE